MAAAIPNDTPFIPNQGPASLPRSLRVRILLPVSFIDENNPNRKKNVYNINAVLLKGIRQKISVMPNNPATNTKSPTKCSKIVEESNDPKTDPNPLHINATPPSSVDAILSRCAIQDRLLPTAQRTNPETLMVKI